MRAAFDSCTYPVAHSLPLANGFLAERFRFSPTIQPAFAFVRIERFVMNAPLVAQCQTARRILLVADDPMEGGMLAEQLISTGNEEYWARDTSEAPCLWMPKD